MCAIDRFNLFLRLDLFDDDVALEPMNRWNYPKAKREIVLRDVSGGHRMEMAKWGLEPDSMHDHKLNTYNARAESLLKPYSMFHGPFASRRCLLFGTSFIEHSDRRPDRKPIEVIPAEGRPYAYAGLYEIAQKENEEVYSCTMMTCEPNSVIGPHHSRMPMLLQPDDWDLWLDPSASRDDLLELLAPFELGGMEVREAQIPRMVPSNKPKEPVQSDSLFD